MNLIQRNIATEDDYWRMRAFLRRVFESNGRRELSWHVARLDYWRWHGIFNMGDGTLESDVVLWESQAGEIAAFLNSEGAGQAFLQVDPAWKSADLEESMIVLAEERLRTTSRRGGEVLWVWSDSQDNQRQEILRKRGYLFIPDETEYQWRRDLDTPIPDAPVAEGYTVRSLGDASELPARSWASWKAFHPEAPDEEYEGWQWYLNIQSAPLYRRDLDIVAATRRGEIAAFTTVWYDDVTRSAIIEPVGTMTEHQRRGLARAVITEGLRRLKRMGATRAFVGGYRPHVNALYSSVLSGEHHVNQPWEKRWQD